MITTPRYTPAMLRHPFLTTALMGALILTVPHLHAEMQSGQSAPDCKLSPLGESAEKMLSAIPGVKSSIWISGPPGVAPAHSPFLS
jgi:hypothetical protein